MNRTKGITYALLVVWAVFAVLFVIKLRNASLHPLQHYDPGGLLFLISQAALAAAITLIRSTAQRTRDTQAVQTLPTSAPERT